MSTANKEPFQEKNRFVHKVVLCEKVEMTRNDMHCWQRVTLDCGHTLTVPDLMSPRPETAWRCAACIREFTF